MTGQHRRAIHILCPGPIRQATGGYGYLRRLADGLCRRGETVTVHELPGRFPVADEATRRAAEAAIGRIPDDSVALADGLALPAVAHALWTERHRLRLVALIHHPLHLETGLAPEQAAGMERLERAALPQFRRILANSNATARDVMALGVPADRIGVVPPGTDPVAPSSGGGGVPVMLCVATLTPRKGHLTLIDALSALTDLPWRLVLAGSDTRDPDHAARIRAAVADRGLAGRIEIAGEVPAERLDALWDGADLFVLPSLHEGYGMAAAEALARGLPVVTTRAGALPEVVPAAAGALVPPGDARELAAALRPLLADPARRAATAAAALVAGRRLPAWDVTIDGIRAELSRVDPRDLRIERIA